MRWVTRIGQGALLLWIPLALAAEPVITEYSFEQPEVAPIKIGNVAYDRVHMPGLANGGQIGEPALPATGARILVPFGKDVTSVEIVTGKRVSLGVGFLIEPVGPPVRLSDPSQAVLPTPDAAIYGSAEPFPTEHFEQIGTQSFRGYQILVLKLQPVEFTPATGELAYYPHLTVIVHTADSGQIAGTFRGLVKDELDLRSRIDNRREVSSYPATQMRNRGDYDLLIITTAALSDEFEPLKDYHDAHGILTEIHTTTDVGSSDPDDVRDYIRLQYQSSGIDYVLIGADDDIIPAKNLFVTAYGENEYNMPADVYFGCLDGTYNYDGDSRWGEPTDGEGGGDVDLIAEVYVGRACVGNATEATRFVDKTLWYLGGQHTHPENVLLVGEHLGFGGESEYANLMMNQLIDGSSADGYTTVGIPSDLYSIDTLYEADGYWSMSDLVTRINSGLHVINHLGHGDVSYAMKLNSGDILSQLSNTDLCFVYSQTCLAGHFDGADCWAETMNIKTDHGAFAVVMNARYGWGDYNTTDGPSQRFDREFWDAVYNPAEGMPQLGAANQDSKEDNLYRINENAMRWCYYGLTLFGDPTVAIGDQELEGMRVSPASDFSPEGQSGGPFTPESIEYTLENHEDVPLAYEVTKSQPWLTITNATGTIPAGGSVLVTVALNAGADSLPDGGYADTLTFTNLTTHEGDTTRDVTLTVGVPTMQYEWPLDSDPGWSTQGQWAWGHPTGGGGQYGNADPTSGHTGPNVYGYNLNGDYTNNMSETHLTTAAIDCSELTNVSLRFWRHLNVETSTYDHAYLRASNDGSSWTTLWENQGEVTDSSWSQQEFDISELADGQPSVYLRWTQGSTDSSWLYSGWNIDDVEIWALAAQSGQTGDMDCDGDVDFDDIDPFVAALGGEEAYNAAYPGCQWLHADCDGDGDVDFDDIDAFVALIGG